MALEIKWVRFFLTKITRWSNLEYYEYCLSKISFVKICPYIFVHFSLSSDFVRFRSIVAIIDHLTHDIFAFVILKSQGGPLRWRIRGFEAKVTSKEHENCAKWPKITQFTYFTFSSRNHFAVWYVVIFL